jgi:pimeloyl-ACP methyl ester carboxylesterase
MATSIPCESTCAEVRARAIRPVSVGVRQEQLRALRRRVKRSRQSDEEAVGGRAEGSRSTKLHAPYASAGADLDWRDVEAKLNALEYYVIEIDGAELQFAHVRSLHDGALALLLTHGWSGSPIELLNVIGPLTDPTLYGGSAEEAFHLVLPTMPPGWSPARLASAFHELMLRLGYAQYVLQGGDWGAVPAELLAVQAPHGLLGIHVNMAGTAPPEIARYLRNFDPLSAFDIPTVAVAVTVFPAGLYHSPRSWREDAFGNLVYWHEVDERGRFAAWQQPHLFAAEVRAAFRSLSRLEARHAEPRGLRHP